MPSHLGPRIPIHPEDRHRPCQQNEARRRQPITLPMNGSHEASTHYFDTRPHTTKSPSTLGPRIPIHPEDRHRRCQENESRWRQRTCPVENGDHKAGTDPPKPLSPLGPRIPIHPSDRLLLLQETRSRGLITNGNYQAPTHCSSPRTPPSPHITASSSSSTLVPLTPIPMSLRGGYSPTLSGNDTPSSTTHHTLHPFEGETLSFFSSTRGLLDYDLANDTWVPSAAAPKVGRKGRGAARVVGEGLVTDSGEMRFLPWYGRLLAARQQEQEEEAEMRWTRERVWARRGGMSGRYTNDAGDGREGGEHGDLGLDGVVDDEEEEEERNMGTSEEESEERRKKRAEEWERREEEREKIEALLAADAAADEGIENDEGSGRDDENAGLDVKEGEPGAERRRKS